MNNDESIFDAKGVAFLKNLSPQDFLNFGVQDIAYVRSVYENGKHRYAVHAANGAPLSVLDDESQALAAIYQNDLEAVTVQ